MLIAKWGLAFLALAACAPYAEETPLIAGDVSVAGPHRATDRFRAFHHEAPLPASLTHETIPLTDWQGEPEPSPIDTHEHLPLGEARLWADLINRIHARVHPIFSDQYLASLDRLPRKYPLDDRNLLVEVELHITQSSGELAAIGLRRSSGLPEFDVAALIAFSKAFPLSIPNELASLNGEVYLTWQARRDDMACSALYAYPFRLK